MLKVKTLTLLDGSTIEDIDLLPGLGSYYILNQDGSIKEVPRERVQSIDYTDKRTVELVKGLALVPMVDDLDTLEEIYDDYESLNALMAEVQEVDKAETPVPDAEVSPLSKNPYGE